MVLGKLNSHMKKNEVGSHTQNKINSKWIKYPNLSEPINLKNL